MAVGAELSIDGTPATAGDLAGIALVNYGAYTSFRVEPGGVRGLDLHLSRLESGAIELFGAPVDEARLRDLIRKAVAGRETGWLRVSLFSPEITPRTPEWRGTPNVLISASPPPAPIAESLRLHVQTYSREAAHLKHVATFGLIRARRAARIAGFDDALFVDGHGLVSEGSLWNIGFVSGDTIIWPQAHMLAGVAQALIQRGLETAGQRGRTESVHLADLDRFDAAFVCNSATPACAVLSIGGHDFDPPSGLIDRLQAVWASNPIQPI